jgi:putative DNA primase/helicase
MVARIAAEDEYNPIMEWMSGRKWDGINRLPELGDSLGIADDFSAMLLRRWLCTAVSLAVDVEPPKAQGVLVLQGPQGLGKSRWLAALTGGRWFREGLTLDVTNKDSVWQAITAWIVELGELDATFRKTEVAQLKAFLTKGADEFRRPYEAETYTFPRRTIFAATVNPDQFLHDPTGSRRFWVIRCTHINPDHGINMQQVWLQALAMRQAGEPTYLSSAELDILNERNENHTEATAEQDLLFAKYDFTKPRSGVRMTAAEVAITLGYEKPTTATARVVGQALRKAIGKPTRSQGRFWWQMPHPRTDAERATGYTPEDDVF